MADFREFKRLEFDNIARPDGTFSTSVNSSIQRLKPLVKQSIIPDGISVPNYFHLTATATANCDSLLFNHLTHNLRRKQTKGDSASGMDATAAEIQIFDGG